MTFYRWAFTVSIILKSGKKRKAHSIIALGTKYSEAYSDMQLTLKKRRSTLISVVKVRVMEVAFAWDESYQFVRRTLADGRNGPGLTFLP